MDRTGDTREEKRDVAAVILNDCAELCSLFRGGRKCHYREYVLNIYVSVNIVKKCYLFLHDC